VPEDGFTFPDLPGCHTPAGPASDPHRSGAGIVKALELVSEIIKRPLSAADAAVAFRDLDGWDSLKGVVLVLKLERALGRQLAENELESLASVGDVDRLLAGT
jgi:acyl carrier protein